MMMNDTLAGGAGCLLLGSDEVEADAWGEHHLLVNSTPQLEELVEQ